MNTVEYGPYQHNISDGLDFYKATMSQLAYEKHPDTQVTFLLKNRNREILTDYVDPQILQARLDIIAEKGFSQDELGFLATIGEQADPMFGSEFISYISKTNLPRVKVDLNNQTDDISVEASGDWPVVSFWETVVMAEINELYFETYCRKNNIDVLALYDEGDARLTEKIEILKKYPEIRFSDYGTRRHFSFRWQKYVVERLKNELPGQFLGSSNIGLSKNIGMRPIGTFAHEMPMVYAALADEANQDIKSSHGKMLDDWYEQYGNKLSIALTDTFGSNFFFKDFTKERALKWRGLRHDSGDPYNFGENAINFYTKNNIDPKSKTIVFSDGLDIKEIIKLHEHFNGRIQLVFGWGTTLTNDLGLPALNIVMKAVEVKSSKNQKSSKSLGTYTVKLSDVESKHTGKPEDIERYRHVFAA